MDLTAPALPVSLLAGPPSGPTTTQAAAASTASASETATRARIDKTAKDYESAFLSIMLGQMFSGVKTTTFGGGEGEEAFKSFMTDAMAKSMVRHGGVGLSKTLAREMLKLQGLAANPGTTPATAAAPSPPPVSAKPVLDIAA